MIVVIHIFHGELVSLAILFGAYSYLISRFYKQHNESWANWHVLSENLEFKDFKYGSKLNLRRRIKLKQEVYF